MALPKFVNDYSYSVSTGKHFIPDYLEEQSAIQITQLLEENQPLMPAKIIWALGVWIYFLLQPNYEPLKVKFK